jgi:WD40 repeat protein
MLLAAAFMACSLVVCAQVSFLHGLRFSADGKLLATAGGDGRAKIVDVASGTTVHVCEGHRGHVYTVAFDPLRPHLVSGGFDSTVRVWDTRTGAGVQVLVGHRGQVLSVDVSPLGTQIASGSSDGTIRLWNAASGAAEAVLRGHTMSVSSVRFSADGTQLLSCATDGTVHVWNVRSGQIVRSVPAEHSCGHAYAAAFSPTSSNIAVSENTATFTCSIWDATSNAPASVLSGHRAPITSVCYLPNGNTIITGGADRTVRLWDVKSGRCMATLADHHGYVSGVAVSPDGATIASCDLSGMMIIRKVAQIINTDDAVSAELRVDPNPARDMVTITFDVLEDASTDVTITDMGGRKIATPLVATPLSRGRHTVRFDASPLADGLYVVVISTPSGTRTTDMHVVR